jgi:hypothetical protein
MKTIFKYLQLFLSGNAITAVTYQPFPANSFTVYNCYYNHYDPVKGYTFSYRHRAYISCFSKELLFIYRLIIYKIFFVQPVEMVSVSSHYPLAGQFVKKRKEPLLCRY